MVVADTPVALCSQHMVGQRREGGNLSIITMWANTSWSPIASKECKYKPALVSHLTFSQGVGLGEPAVAATGSPFRPWRWHGMYALSSPPHSKAALYTVVPAVASPLPSPPRAWWSDAHAVPAVATVAATPQKYMPRRP